ncbi:MULTISPECIES: DUF5317 family protein [unclassified Fusibacter]|uniref:DUF5317 family protein n=1 Tax=unclassified Fusibacter TaxID=2624464 RepID=UPI0010137EDC|nr:MULTISPECIES: DUF5317 family protein [unclassified Fusibacter]MCK8059433.1 DUF5317 domain-containing protein [Fusibacter sp. A2]NPE21103.1 DUF5317 domain-containing protein [Fusibacter sp. A1]RXV62373.1 hypothetical protein DWB64_04655 [Fusibacter sp. A1]
MWFEAILLGLIIGVIRGGRLSNLENSHVKGAMLIVLGLLLQLIPFFLHAVEFVATNAKYFTIAGLAMAIIALLLNLKKRGIWLVGLGAILQVVVLILNDMLMPIRLAGATSAKLVQMRLAIESGEIANYVLFNQSTHWSKFLGKTILMPDVYPFTVAIGIPDLIIAIGMILFIQNELQIVRTYRTYTGKRRY